MPQDMYLNGFAGKVQRQHRPYREIFGAIESAFGKRQRIIDLTKNPQCKSVANLRCDAVILAELVGEVAMARLVVEFDRF